MNKPAQIQFEYHTQIASVLTAVTQPDYQLCQVLSCCAQRSMTNFLSLKLSFLTGDYDTELEIILSSMFAK